MGKSKKESIGIIDADLMDNGTRHPNLALMKISGYYKHNEHDVTLITDYSKIKKFDKVYISKVFTFTKVPEEILNMDNLDIGGTGFYPDGGKDLPYYIEHHPPDYSLYEDYIKQKTEGGCKISYRDYLDYSIGFTTRGCFRKCDFCVNKKYDFAFKHSPVNEFVDNARPSIYLWDDNFFAYSGWESILNDLEETGKPFQFRQGLDIRLLTKKKAERFADTKYSGDIIFAFDHITDSPVIKEKLKLWRDYSHKTTKVYAICGYSSQDVKDVVSLLIRIKILMQHGCVPYIMRHENYQKSPYKDLYVQLARWCNQPRFFKKMSFREYCEANQKYSKKGVEEKICKSLDAMNAFEEEYPNVTSRFFDLKFENENAYRVRRYGKRHPYLQSCEYCQKNRTTWNQCFEDQNDDVHIISSFFSKNLDLSCLRQNAQCQHNEEECSKKIMDVISKTDIKDLLEIVSSNKYREPITLENIPQFGTYDDLAYYHIDKIYSQKNCSFNTSELGTLLRPMPGGDLANSKYGENHGKIYCLLDLLDGQYDEGKLIFSTNVLGNQYLQLSYHERDDFIAKMSLKIPIIRETLKIGLTEKTSPEMVLKNNYKIPVSQKTIDRRLTNINSLLTHTISQFNATEKKILRNNIKPKQISDEIV